MAYLFGNTVSDPSSRRCFSFRKRPVFGKFREIGVFLAFAPLFDFQVSLAVFIFQFEPQRRFIVVLIFPVFSKRSNDTSDAGELNFSAANGTSFKWTFIAVGVPFGGFDGEPYFSFSGLDPVDHDTAHSGHFRNHSLTQLLLVEQTYDFVDFLLGEHERTFIAVDRVLE